MLDREFEIASAVGPCQVSPAIMATLAEENGVADDLIMVCEDSETVPGRTLILQHG